MNREEALSIFELNTASTDEEIREQWEQKLFAQKNEALQKYMVPTLLFKKIRTLEPIAEGESVLLSILPKEVPDHKFVGPYHTQSAFLEAYEENVSTLKLALMSAASFNELLDAMAELADLQERYMDFFKEQFNEYSEALPEEVNTREMIDTGTLLQGLKAGDLHAHMIWNIERELARISKIQKLSA